MNDVRDYLLTVDSDKIEASKIAQSTADSMLIRQHLRVRNKLTQMLELQSKQITLIDVVQSLGEYVTDEDATIRSKAVRYLSEVIGAVPPNFLSRQQVQVLCQFLCDRVEDGGAVLGLSKLQSLPKFTSEMAVMTFRA